MIKLLDIIKALRDEVQKSVPGTGSLLFEYDGSEKVFSYYITNNPEKKANASTKDCILTMQVIYFGTQVGEKKTTPYAEKLEVREKLKKVLDKYFLQVGDRALKFDYNFGSFDEDLYFYITFRYLDGLDIEKEVYEMIEKIEIKEA